MHKMIQKITRAVVTTIVAGIYFTGAARLNWFNYCPIDKTIFTSGWNKKFKKEHPKMLNDSSTVN